MNQRRAERLLACLLLATAVAMADSVVLRNGFRIDADRCEAGPDTVRLHVAGGWIEVPATDVERIEPLRPQRQLAAESDSPDEPGGSVDAFDRFAAEAGIPPELARAVAWAESGLRPDAISTKGAIGLMQLMPATAAELGVNPHDPEENIRGGAQYLKRMLEQFRGDSEQLVKALAAYNAGPGAVSKHGGVPPYPETAAYVGNVIRRYLHPAGSGNSTRNAAR